MNKIVMGSVYMDRGEGLAYIEAQVGRMARQGPEQYFLDIICRPDQIRDATKLLERFYELIADVMPLEKVHTAVTCNDQIRPAAMAIVLLTHGDPGGMIDVNPGRPGR